MLNAQFNEWVGDGEITLRSFSQTDVGPLMVLCRKHAEFEGSECDLARIRHNCHIILSASGSPFCWVVAHQGYLVGYVSGSLEFSTWNMWHYLHMDCIYLETQYRGKGIGSWIIMLLASHSEKLGAKQIQWQTPTSNSDAILFYNSLGATGKDKVRYTLDL